MSLSETKDVVAVTPKLVSLDRTSCCEHFRAGAAPLEYSRGGAY